mmetsp:Transcript_8473/g.17423  ORF Transcript_8473/g.17423 Transcript_8473/m.17423 type:complete len:88 (+) Transcript_8473:567-830(+)
MSSSSDDAPPPSLVRLRTKTSTDSIARHLQLPKHLKMVGCFGCCQVMLGPEGVIEEERGCLREGAKVSASITQPLPDAEKTAAGTRT